MKLRITPSETRNPNILLVPIHAGLLESHMRPGLVAFFIPSTTPLAIGRLNGPVLAYSFHMSCLLSVYFSTIWRWKQAGK